MPYRWLFLGLMLFWLLGCSEQQSTEPLKVGSNQWIGYEPLYLAQQLGLYNHLPIKLVELTSSTDVINAFHLKKLDVAALTLDEVIRLLDAEPDLVIFLIADISNGADAVLARQDINQITDLKGKRLGVEASALGAYFLSLILKQADLEKDQVTVIPSTIDSHLQMMTSDKLDAVITFEPTASKLEAKGFQRIFDSRQTPGKIVDVLVTRKDVLTDHLNHLKLLVRSHWKALAYLENNPNEAAQIIASHLNIDPEQLLTAYQGLELPDREENIALLEESIKQTASELEMIMLQEHLVRKPHDLTHLFTSELVQ